MKKDRISKEEFGMITLVIEIIEYLLRWRGYVWRKERVLSIVMRLD